MKIIPIAIIPKGTRISVMINDIIDLNIKFPFYYFQ
ncbi:hypothetical protein PLGE761_21320 [Pluralibacter gergoviae]|nr:Uncharacterised protein [Pluralibacter gergoviae]